MQRVATRLALTAIVEYHSPYIYPPLLGPPAAPARRVALFCGRGCLVRLSAGALLAALWLLRTSCRLPWRIYGWVCAAAFFLPPVHHTLQHGQITHFLLLLIVVGSRRWGRSGVGRHCRGAQGVSGDARRVYALSGRMAALVAMAGRRRC